jgi:CheY-like chemotaxis protein
MVLRPAFAIHTHFMRFPIDVVFLDSDQVVIAVEKEVRPWKTASCRGAREVVELAAGECDRRGLEVGDRVAWASRSAADVRADSTGSLWEDTPEPRGRVLVVSRDPRFVKLARFLFEGRDLEVDELSAPERLPDAIRDPDLDVVVLDGGTDVAAALRNANRCRGLRPETPIVIAADAGGRSPTGIRVFDRWNETEELLLDVERVLAEQLPATTPLPAVAE